MKFSSSWSRPEWPSKPLRKKQLPLTSKFFYFWTLSLSKLLISLINMLVHNPLQISFEKLLFHPGIVIWSRKAGISFRKRLLPYFPTSTLVRKMDPLTLQRRSSTSSWPTHSRFSDVIFLLSCSQKDKIYLLDMKIPKLYCLKSIISIIG